MRENEEDFEEEWEERPKLSKEEIKKILNAGAKKAEARAEEKMKVVRKRMGLSL